MHLGKWHGSGGLRGLHSGAKEQVIMATGSSSPPMLRLKRSTQSGSVAMAAAAAWVVAYTESCPMAYIFAGAEIDLTTMILGDSIDIRVRKQLVGGGGWVNHALTNYIDAQPAGHPAIHINPIPDVFGIEISARQNLGALRTFPAEFFDAKRIGLS